MRFWSRRRTAASETFEDVLARCLASVNDGTRDVDACLAAYPQYADRLGPALRTAVAVRAGLDARPNAAFVQRARARVIAAANGIQPVASPPPHTRRAPTLRPLALTAAAFVLLFAVLIPSLAVTSASALPGDWNYGIKLVTEQARLAVMFDAADRQAYHLELSERRAHEITRLVELGRVEEIPAATRAYQDELAKAVAPVKRSSPPSLSEAEKIRDSVTQQEVMLTIALRRMQEDETAPSPNSPTPAGTSTQSRSQTPPPTDPSQPAPAAATETPRASAPQQATQVIEAVQTARDAAHGARAEAALATERAQEVERTRVQQVVTPLPSETATAARPTGTPTPASPTPTPTSSPVPNQTASPTAGPLNDGAGGSAASPSATGTASAVASPQPTTGTTSTATASPSETRTATATTPAVLTPEPSSRSTPIPTPEPRSTPPVLAAAPPVTTVPAPLAPRSLPPPVQTPPPEATPDPVPAPAAPTATPADATPLPSATPAPALAAVEPTPAAPTPALAVPQPSSTTAPSAAAVVPTEPAQTAPGQLGPAPVSPSVVPRAAMVELSPGINLVLYRGPTQYVDEVLAPLQGKYVCAEWSPPGSPFRLRYCPGMSTNRPLITSGSIVTLYMIAPASIPMGAITAISAVR